MASIPNKIADRLVLGIQRFHPVLSAAKARGGGELDAVIIVTDMLADVFGYEKYTDILTESAVESSGGNLAVRIQDKLLFLVRCKAVGADLTEASADEAVASATGRGVEWVVLTNGQQWRIYQAGETQPANPELLVEFDLFVSEDLSDERLEKLYLLTKESCRKAGLDGHLQQRQVLNPFSVAATLLSDTVLELVRRELRRLSPSAKISVEEVASALRKEVLKAELVEGPKAAEAQSRMAEAQGKSLRKRGPKADSANTGEGSESPAAPTA